MPIKSENQKVKDGEVEKDIFVLKFTNGALDQLRKLKKFYKTNEEGDVVKMGISFLQKIMEGEGPKNDKNE